MRFLRTVTLSLSLLVLLLLWGMRMEWFQDWATTRLEALLSQQFDTEVHIGGLDLDLPAKLVLRDFEMKDQQGQPLFAGGEVRVGMATYSIIDLIRQPNTPEPIHIRELDVLAPFVSIYKSRADSSMNLDFLSGPPSTTGPPKPVQLSFRALDVHIAEGRFNYIDSTKSDSALMVNSRLNFSHFEFAGINTQLSFQMDPVLKMAGEISSFQAREEWSFQTISRLEGIYTLDVGPDAAGGLEVCFQNALLVTGPRTRLDFDATFANVLGDSAKASDFPAFTINFRPSALEFAALNAFLPKPLPMVDPATIEGMLYGDLQNIYSSELLIGIYDDTRLRTSLALKDFTDDSKLAMKLRLKPSDVSFEELKRFLPGVDIPLAGKAKVDGIVDFDLKQIFSPDLHIRYGAYTDMRVRMRVRDFSDPNPALDFQMENSKVDFAEVLELLPSLSLPDWLANVERTEVDGEFQGTPKDFQLNAALRTKMGNLAGDIRIQSLPGGDIAYNGSVSTTRLDLDALRITKDNISNNINFAGSVEGRGTQYGKMNVLVNGKLTDSELMGYQIDLLEVQDASLDGYKIEGKANLVDPEGSANVTVYLDQPPNERDSISITGDVADLDFDHYGILEGDSLFLTSIMAVRLGGDSLENYAGRLTFLQIDLRRDTVEALSLRNVTIDSKFRQDSIRDITLKSSLAQMHLGGRFKLGEAVKVGSRIAEEITLYLRNNDTIISQYYAAKAIEDSLNVLGKDIHIYDTLVTKPALNDFFTFLGLPLYFSPGTELILELDHGNEEDILVVNMTSDSISAYNLGLAGNDMAIDLIKYGDRNELVLSGKYVADHLWATKDVMFSDFTVEPEGDDKILDVFVHFQQPSLQNKFLLRTKTQFLSEGRIKTFILPANSLIDIKGREWKFSRGNLITRSWESPPGMDNPGDSLIDRIFIKDLRLSHEDQSISVEGYVSSDYSDILTATLSNIQIGELLEIAETHADVDGVVENITLNGWNLLGEQIGFYANGLLSEFRYGTLDSLEIEFFAGWPYVEDKDYLKGKVKIEKAGLDSLELDGYYGLVSDSLFFEALPSKFPLNWLEPFVEGELTDMEGRIFIPSLVIRGTTKEPRINGSAYLDGVGLRVDYLNTFFRLGNNELKFTEGQLEIPLLAVRDTFGGSAELHGNVDYQRIAFARANFGMNNIERFTLMNTRKGMNPDFYGRIVLQGDTATVSGPLDRLNIQARVNTGPGTWMDIPLDNYTSASRLDYVQFVSGGKALEVTKKVPITGIGMEVTVQANPDARLRLILNEQAGDIIEAKGTGAITLKITEQGEFGMSGTYTLDEGNYLFTAENIVNKKFIVRPGGTIFFNGDPYNAELNLDAVYKVNANISDLLPGQTGRVPVDIVMHMTGSLEEPTIKLELQIDELRQQDVMGLAGYFRRIEEDAQELNKQVVSLLLFGRFSGTAAGGGNTAGSGVTSSISELISNQLNYWISQAFQDANLGLEVNTNQFQDVELAVRTTLFNNRVTVERNGAIISNQNRGVTLGDLSVQLKLLPRYDSNQVQLPGSGQLVMEIFNREDAGLNAAMNITRGVGVFYKRDFDRIPDLFKRAKVKGEGKLEETE